MRAMVLEATGDIDASPLTLQEVDEPVPEPREVCVAISACAVCRTDLHVIEGDLPPVKRPVIPGHQAVGRVTRLGKECGRLVEGDLVGVAWLRSTDGSCGFCRSGRENLCPASEYTGYHHDGGYAEYVTVPEDFAYPLPSDFDAVSGAPLLCAGLIGYRALKRANLPENGRLLLVGFGSSAHVVLQIALHRGHETFVVTRSANHIRQARDLGAHWAGTDAEELPVPVDSAILFAPVGALVPRIMTALDRGGTLSIAGIHLSDVPALNYERHLFYDKEIRSVAANTRADGKELLIEAAAASVRPHVITYHLSEANRALQDMKHSRVEGTGVLVLS